MRYIVSGQGYDALDTKCDVAYTLHEAYELADDYEEAGYEIDIVSVYEKQNDDKLDTYEDLKELMNKYEDYDKFISGIEPFIYKYLKKNDLLNYVKDKYEAKNFIFDGILIPQYLKIDIDSDLYLHLKEKADSAGLSVESYVYSLIRR